MRNDLKNGQTSAKTADYSGAALMAAYDQLPKAVRTIVGQAVLPWETISILGASKLYSPVWLAKDLYRRDLEQAADDSTQVWGRPLDRAVRRRPTPVASSARSNKRRHPTRGRLYLIVPSVCR